MASFDSFRRADHVGVRRISRCHQLTALQSCLVLLCQDRAIGSLASLSKTRSPSILTLRRAAGSHTCSAERTTSLASSYALCISSCRWDALRGGCCHLPLSSWMQPYSCVCSATVMLLPLVLPRTP